MFKISQHKAAHADTPCGCVVWVRASAHTDTPGSVLSGELKSAGLHCWRFPLCWFLSPGWAFRYQRGSPQRKMPCSQGTTSCVRATPSTAAPPWWPSAPALASTSSCWTLWVLHTHHSLMSPDFHRDLSAQSALWQRHDRKEVRCTQESTAVSFFDILLYSPLSSLPLCLSLSQFTVICFYFPRAAFTWENTY